MTKRTTREIGSVPGPDVVVAADGAAFEPGTGALRLRPIRPMGQHQFHWEVEAGPPLRHQAVDGRGPGALLRVGHEDHEVRLPETPARPGRIVGRRAVHHKGVLGLQSAGPHAVSLADRAIAALHDDHALAGRFQLAGQLVGHVDRDRCVVERDDGQGRHR